MLINGPKEIPDDAISNNIVERFFIVGTPLLEQESSLPRVMTYGRRHCYQTLCCHHQLTCGGKRRINVCAPLDDFAVSIEILPRAARVVAESAAGSRSLCLSSLASIVREKVAADSKVSDLPRH